MPKEKIDEEFNKVLWRFNSIEKVDSLLETKLRIAFQEGIIHGEGLFKKSSLDRVEKRRPLPIKIAA